MVKHMACNLNNNTNECRNLYLYNGQWEEPLRPFIKKKKTSHKNQVWRYFYYRIVMILIVFLKKKNKLTPTYLNICA